MSELFERSLNVGETFGRRMRKHRRARDLTLEEAAALAGLSPNYLGSIELGKRDPSFSTIIAIAKALRVSPDDLVGPVSEISPAILELARLFDSIGPFPLDDPPTPVAPACRIPPQYAVPFFPLDLRQQIAPWRPRRASRG